MLRFILLIGVFSTFLICKTCMNNSDNDKEKTSIFWRISGNNLKDTSYLYGTIHVQDNRVFGYDDIVNKAFQKAKVLAVEIDLDKCNPKTIIGYTFMKDSSLDQLLSSEQLNKLEKSYAILTGVSIEESFKVKPFFLSGNILNSIIPGEGTTSLDLFFIRQAKKMGKSIVGLETLKEQVETIDEIPYSVQANMLYNMVDDIPKLRKQYNNLLEAYLNMNSEKLMHFLEDSLMPEKYLDKIVNKRNHNIVKRLEPLIKKESTFIAIGAGHLYDNNGVVSLLKGMGYKLEPIHFKFKQ